MRTTITTVTHGGATIQVALCDADGSGTPCVSLELTHPYLDRTAAVALDSKESELVARALIQTGSKITPAEHLRARFNYRRWKQQL